MTFRRRGILVWVAALLAAAVPAAVPAAGAPRGSGSYDVAMLRRAGGEPTLAVSPDGRTVLVSGAAPGRTGMYRSLDGGRTYHHLRPRFARSGNADVDLMFLDDGTVVAADLSRWGSGDGVLVHRSTDRGSTWTTTSIPGLYDRPWLGRVGGTVYVVARGADQVPYVVASTDAGRTFGPPFPLADLDGAEAATNVPVVVQHVVSDARRRVLYVLRQHGTDLYVSRLTPSVPPVVTTRLAARDAYARNGFNWLAVDAAGTVYVLAHEDRGGGEGSWLYRSTDGGSSWRGPVDVGASAGTGTVFGAIAGGARGRLSLVYLRGSGRPSTQAQPWYAEVAVVTDADTARPRVSRERPLARPVHTAEICSSLLCPADANRNLLEFVSTRIAPDGTVLAVVGSDGPATGDTPAVGPDGVTAVVFRARRR